VLFELHLRAQVGLGVGRQLTFLEVFAAESFSWHGHSGSFGLDIHCMHGSQTGLGNALMSCTGCVCR